MGGTVIRRRSRSSFQTCGGLRPAPAPCFYMGSFLSMDLSPSRHPVWAGMLLLVMLANHSFLVAQDAAPPDREQLQPADDLSGPPFVTCKAWAVIDGRTGKLLFGHHENQPLDNAS